MGFIGRQPTPVPLTSSDITDGIISTAKIVDDAVGNTKLDLTANYAFTGTITGAGGMDLLLDATLTSSLGNIDISSTYINSTYDDYLLLFNLDPDEDDRHLYIQVFVGGSALGGDVYAYEVALLSGNEYENDNDTTVFRLNSHGIGYDSGEGISGQLLFQNVNDTSHSFCYSGFTNFFNTSGNHNGNAVSGTLIPANRASVVNGLRIYFSGGQAVGDFKLYGLRT